MKSFDMRYRTDAVTFVHDFKGLVDLGQSLAVSDEFINLECAFEIILDKGGQFASSLDATESGSSPYATGDELEWSSGNFLSGSGNTDDDALAPALMASFEGSAHNLDVTGTIESVVAAAIRHFDEVFLDGFVYFSWVYEIGCTELTRPFFFAVIDIYSNDFLGTIGDTALDDTETDTTDTEDGTNGAFLDFGSTSGSTETGRDTTSKKTSFVKGSLRVDGNNRDIGND